MSLRLVVDDPCILPVRVVGVLSRRVLELGDGVRGPHVLLAANAKGVLAAGVERVLEHRIVAECRPVNADRLLGHLEHTDSLDVRIGAGEVFLHQAARQTDRLEDLCAGIRHIGRDAHLGHHLAKTFSDRLDEVLARLVGVHIFELALLGKCDEGLERQVRVDRFGTEAAKQAEVMHLAGRAGLHHQPRAGAQSLLDEVLVNCREAEQRGNRDVLAVHPAIGNDEDRVTRSHRVFRLRTQAGQPRLDRLLAPAHRIGEIQLAGAELAVGVLLDMPDRLHLGEIEHRLADLQTQRRIHLVNAEQVRFRTDERDETRHELLANGIDRGIRDLREHLLEVVVERLVPVGEHR